MAKAKATQQRAEYTVVARRYRPQQLADLVGQEHVAQALTNALTSGRVAHAYLFTGARGTGKTSTARILAKCLTCVKGPTPTPCDQCEICMSIMAGDDVDVLEIDGASNNKVDEARELRQNVGFRPARARYKIYIIDEVHMLSTGAFNALLKTLEEPPAHVKFILATTEIQKIPITILSRCQRFDFAYVRPAKIFEALKRIVTQEGLQAEDAALQIIARRAAGSMRDSQSLLDQLLAFCNGPLTAAKVHELLGSTGDERVTELAQLILKNDAAGALAKLQQFSESGFQIGELLDQLVEYWRGLMMVLAAGPAFPDLPGSPEFQLSLKEQAKGLKLDTVLAGLDVLTTTKARLRGSLHAATLLEMALVRLARLDDLVNVGALLSGESVKPTVASVESSKKNSRPTPADSNGSAAVGLDPANPQQIAEFLKAELGPVKGTLLAAAGPPAILGPQALAFRFPAGYDSAYEACADERATALMLSSLKRATGVDWQVRFEPPESAPVPRPEPPRVNRTDELLALPLFQKAREVLGAQLVKIDDGFSPVAIGNDEPTEV